MVIHKENPATLRLAGLHIRDHAREVRGNKASQNSKQPGLNGGTTGAIAEM
jgi:hypothetical protein